MFFAGTSLICEEIADLIKPTSQVQRWPCGMVRWTPFFRFCLNPVLNSRVSLVTQFWRVFERALLGECTTLM